MNIESYAKAKVSGEGIFFWVSGPTLCRIGGQAREEILQLT
jgi:hypothetical protein